MIVVSDTSPIFNLAAVGKLHLLSDLYAETRVVAAQNQNNVAMLRGELDPGEAEAIVVAAELEAELLLVDEKRGRRIAIDRGLEVTGLSECLPKPRHGVSYLDVSLYSMT